MVGGAGRTVEDRVLAFGDGWAPMIAGIEDDVFDRFARLQDRTDKPLELTASGPDPDRRTLTRLRDRAEQLLSRLFLVLGIAPRSWCLCW